MLLAFLCSWIGTYGCIMVQSKYNRTSWVRSNKQMLCEPHRSLPWLPKGLPNMSLLISLILARYFSMRFIMPEKSLLSSLNISVCWQSWRREKNWDSSLNSRHTEQVFSFLCFLQNLLKVWCSPGFLCLYNYESTSKLTWLSCLLPCLTIRLNIWLKLLLSVWVGNRIGRWRAQPHKSIVIRSIVLRVSLSIVVSIYKTTNWVL